MAKRLEFLREVAPNERTVALLMNPDNLNYQVDVKATREAAAGLGRETVIVEARHPAAIDGAFASIVARRAGAVLVASDPMFLGQRDRLTALALRHALPIVAWTREFAEAGNYAGRILRGAKPSDLPVIQPTHFDLVINLKAARALGVNVPSLLLQRADEVIR